MRVDGLIWRMCGGVAVVALAILGVAALAQGGEEPPGPAGAAAAVPKADDESGDKQGKRPNIVVLMTDDQTIETLRVMPTSSG